MDHNKIAAITSEHGFAMEVPEAEISLASLFYFQSKMPDAALKKQFSEKLVQCLADHAAVNMQHEKKTPYISAHERAENYGDKEEGCRLSWILTYAAKVICQENPKGADNPFKQYFSSYLPYMFDTEKQAFSFQQKKPKLVTLVQNKKRFSFANWFKSKPLAEKKRDEVAKHAQDFLRDDPFIAAIDHCLQSGCIKELQQNIDMFADRAAPALQGYWEAKKMTQPFVEVQEKAQTPVVALARPDLKVMPV